VGYHTVRVKFIDVEGDYSPVYSDYINLLPVMESVTLPGGVTVPMVWIPAGTFAMGGPDTEDPHFSWEGPQHPVALSGYWIGMYELTKRQWQAVMNTAPWSGKANVLADPDSPAVYVTWDDAQAFLTALNACTGKTFRLPTEAQWEYACRAGTSTRFYWGDDPSYALIGNYGWYKANASDIGESYAHVVGLKRANGFGLYDMSGNAVEWCQDWYGTYTADAQTNPRGPATGSCRVLRGGNCSSWEFELRSDNRDCNNSFASPNFGFRLAR
jgi:formylglycine-generating enzyme required for sulfatase activity